MTTETVVKNETRNPHELPKGISSDADWDNGIDEAYFLEATEDVELAEAADVSLLSSNSGVDEIPDELIIEAIKDKDEILKE